MSNQESEPTTTGNPRLDNWDQNAWENAVYGTAGTTDFSDEAHQHAVEGDAYEHSMSDFAKDVADPFDRYQDGVENGEVKDGIDRAIEADDELRAMDELARKIAKIRAINPKSASIKIEEDRLNEVLLNYRGDTPKVNDRYADAMNKMGDANKAKLDKEMEGKDLEAAKIDVIIDRIIEHTQAADSTEAKGEDDDTKSNPDDSPEGPKDGSEGGSDGKEEKDKDPAADQPTEELPKVDSPDSPSEDEPTEQVTEALAVIPKEEREIIDRLYHSREHYAELTARDREGCVRRFTRESKFYNKFLKRIPVVSSIVGLIDHNLDHKREWNSAVVENYQRDLDNYVQFVRKQSVGEIQDLSEVGTEKLKQDISVGLLREDERLEAAIMRQQHENGSIGGRFVDWWVRTPRGKTDSFVRGLVKGGVIIGGGALIGATAGAAVGLAGIAGLAGLAGSAAGGVYGIGLSQYINGRRANATSVVDGQETTYAEQDSAENAREKRKILQASPLDTDNVAEGFVGMNEDLTNERVKKNERRRKIFAGLAGAAGGVAGGFAGNWMHNITQPKPQAQNGSKFMNNHSQGAGNSNGTNQPQPGTSGPSKATPNVAGNTPNTAPNPTNPAFRYSYGEAPERLLQHFSPNQLGQHLDGRQSYKLLEELSKRLGKGNVFDNIKLVEHSKGNLWIPNPGGTTHGLTKQAAELAKELVASGKI